MSKKRTALKAAVGVAAGIATAYYGMGAIICYEVLSKKSCNRYPEELLDAPGNRQRYANDDNFRYADDWYNAIAPEDTVLLNKNREKLLAKIITPEVFSHKWLIAVHGYTSRPRAMARQSVHFFEQCYNILMPCQRAHRNQENRFSSMGYYEKYDIIEWIKYIVSLDPEAEIVLLGVSMGSATVMLTTGEKLPENVKCCIADCGYTNCRELFKNSIKKQIGLPPFPFLDCADSFCSAFLGWSFSDCAPEKAVQHSHTPTLFIHGEDDKLVPPYMARELFEKCSAQKQLLMCPSAGHDEACSNQPEMYWQAVDGFVKNFV